MKRRRHYTPFALLRLQANLYGGEVIPPRSVIVASEKNAANFNQEQYRIGYYNPNDGLDCVWLVNQNGDYEQTADQRFIRRNFTIIERSSETDLYGRNQQSLGPLKSTS